LKKIYFYTFFQFALFHGPIIILFYQHHALTLSNIYLLQTLHYFAKLAFEIPAGVFADSYKKKYSLFLGALLVSASYTGIFFSQTFILFALFEIIAGIGRSLISGADSALIYETLKRKNNLSLYHHVESINFTILNTAFILYAVASGYIARINLSLPYLFSAIFIGAAAILALTIDEPKEKHKPEDFAKISSTRLTDGWRAIKQSKALSFLTAFGAIFLFLRELNFYTEQPLLSKVGIEIQFFGFLPAIGAAIWAGTSYFSPKIIVHIGEKRSFLLVLILFLLPSLWLASSTERISDLVLYVIYYFSYGLGEPLIRINSNSSIKDSSVRTTVLSIQSTLGLLPYCLFASFFGYLLDTRPLNMGFFVFSAISLALLVYTIYWLLTNQQESFENSATLELSDPSEKPKTA